MIGPKKDATRAVPWLCTQNSVTRITIVIGMTYSVSLLVTRSRPSTAESTEIAGVMMASPENNAAPATPSRNTIFARRPTRRPSADCASAISDRMPPSPRLSARIRNTTYLAVTVKISA